MYHDQIIIKPEDKGSPVVVNITEYVHSERDKK